MHQRKRVVLIRNVSMDWPLEARVSYQARIQQLRTHLEQAGLAVEILDISPSFEDRFAKKGADGMVFFLRCMLEMAERLHQRFRIPTHLVTMLIDLPHQKQSSIVLHDWIKDRNLAQASLRILSSLAA